MVATDPSSLPADVRHKLLLARVALIHGDAMEANHWLYAIACPSFTCLDPWAAIEGRTCQCGPHSLKPSSTPPTIDELESAYAPDRPTQETSPVPVWPVTQHFDCHKCAKHRTLSYMIVCPTCGNKRCPKASDHELACTNSNAPGQPGSIY